MGLFVPFRMAINRQTVHSILLVFVWLAELKSSSCFSAGLYNRRTSSASSIITPFSPDPNAQQHIGNPHLSARVPPGSYRGSYGRVTVPDFLSTTPRRELSATFRSPHGVKVLAKSNNIGAPPDEEVQALLALKAAVTSDPLDALRTWTIAGAPPNDTCTGWVGVTCSPVPPNHVVGLNLSDFRLGGTLDSVLPTLGGLPFLEFFDLAANALTGSIQGESLTNLSSHLDFFNLSKNVLTGEIPSEIGKLASLQRLDVSYNNLTGSIPESIGNCSLLFYVDVGSNFLEGEIPASLGALPLRDLYLNDNLLSGNVPGALGNCSSLLQLSLTGNYRIEGVIPKELSQLKQLEALLADDCYFSGTFPPWIGNLTSLSVVSITQNNLLGEIPDTIGQLPALRFLAFGVNGMTGGIPLSIGNLSSLLMLQIVSANISGPIPPQIGLLQNLQILSLADNKLTGVIPSTIANCSALSWLELGSNPTMDPQPIPSWIGSLTSLVYVYFTSMNLEGEFPETIGKLSNLQKLDMAQNNLSGAIPVALQNCTYLGRLDLGENQLTGDLSTELGRLQYMSWFSVASNSLAGSFPEFITNWTQISLFSVSFNQFSGPLDGRVETNNLEQLSELDASNNHFEGPIPENFSNRSSISVLNLSGNQLSGAIPDSLGNMTSLQALYLFGNNLRGEIPMSLLNPALQLVFLDLRQNELEDFIPYNIGQLSQLTDLLLSNNRFVGEIPSSIGNCSQLLVLDLSYNLLTGSWPTGFSKLVTVQTIDVSNNNISGSIPVGLGHCFNLNSLDVSMNNFTGAIPEDLGSLTGLAFFNASFNDFVGPIPPSGIFNSNRINESSFLGNPGLCGPFTILGSHHQACTAAIPRNVSTHNGDSCEGFKCKSVWIPVVAGIAFALALLGAAVFIIFGIRSRRIRSNSAKPVLLNFGTKMRLSEKDVLRTISNPNGENVIGVGARSIVYKGVLQGGEVFALKKLLPKNDDHDHDGIDSDPQGRNSDQLVKEAATLAKFRHKNILKCLSLYSSLDHKALMLEYMSGGSLHKQLHESEPCLLTWQIRLKVAMGVAQGMKYLHHDFPEPLIHRDLKPSNILLDANFEPKVGDFGISKFVRGQGDGVASASTFNGTIGYMPPEYASQAWVSTKGDVFSYGMVLIELLTRRQPCSADVLEDQGTDLRSWVLDSFHESPLELLDPSLRSECEPENIAREQMLLLLRISLFCTRGEPQSRPSMIDVVGMLTYVVSFGVEPVIRRTLEELANTIDPSVWASEDPSLEGAEFGSSN